MENLSDSTVKYSGQINSEINALTEVLAEMEILGGYKGKNPCCLAVSMGYKGQSRDRCGCVTSVFNTENPAKSLKQLGLAKKAKFVLVRNVKNVRCFNDLADLSFRRPPGPLRAPRGTGWAPVGCPSSPGAGAVGAPSGWDRSGREGERLWPI